MKYKVLKPLTYENKTYIPGKNDIVELVNKRKARRQELVDQGVIEKIKAEKVDKVEKTEGESNA